ncbi:MAG: universal stress protein [Patescibacteria group bacterium]
MKILIATDGKKHSENAIAFVGNLFQAIKPQITVLHVHPTDRESEETVEQAKIYLERAEEILASFKIKIRKKIIKEGNIVKEILKESRLGSYDMLAIGSERLSSVISSLTESILEDDHQQIARNLKISLLVVKDSSTEVKNVLLCTDGSVMAEAAIEFWGRLRKKQQPLATILNIIPKAFVRFSDELSRHKDEFLKVLSTFGGPRTEAVEKGQKILDRYSIEAKTILRERKYASEEILKEEKDGHYDLIIMGYRGRDHRGEQMGCQSLDVVQKSKSSVLIFKFSKAKK